jgi:hypothetical protein
MGTLTLSLFLKQGHNQIIISEEALKKYIKHKRKKGTGKWRKLHNGYFHNVYY